MEKQENSHLLCKVGVLFLLYIGISFLLYWHFKEQLYKNMVWNVFLTLLPLLFADILWIYAKKWGYIRKSALGILWLLFFPNSPYMITDIIHISGNSFFLNEYQYNQLTYSTNMTLWIRIVYIGIGILIGVLSGLLSLRMIHSLLSRHVGLGGSHILLLAICGLSGYGIYLGRFLRLNSWNLIHLHWFLGKVKGTSPAFAFKFTILYAFFIYVIYWIFCIFYPKISAVHMTDGKAHEK